MNSDIDVWYCRTLGIELGPMSLPTLLGLAHDGELSAEDEVRRGAQGGWAPARAVAELHAAFCDPQPLQKPWESPKAALNLAAEPTTGKEVPASSGAAPPDLDRQRTPVPLPLVSESELAAHTKNAPGSGPTGDVSSRSMRARTGRGGSGAGEPWYCEIAGVKYGPARFQHLQDTFAIGRLAPDDLVKKGRNGSWQQVRSIPALMLGGNLPSEPAISQGSAAVQAGDSGQSGEPGPTILPAAPWRPPRWVRTSLEVVRQTILFLGIYFYIIAAVFTWVTVNIIVVYFPKEGYLGWLMFLRAVESPVTWVWVVAIGCYMAAILVKVRWE